MDAEDADEAIRHGVDAIVVSNHGGRQLDGAPATIDVISDISKTVGRRAEIWLDSGIRSGQDIFKALALGANGTMIGRAYQYGLGAMGKAGISKCLEILRKELDLTMGFCGANEITDISKNNIL